MKAIHKSINTVEFAKALADETRQKIMRLCCCDRVNVNDIVEQLDVSQPTVSHHLKILKDAGLVHAQREGKQVFYSLNQNRLADSCCLLSDNFAPNITLAVQKDT